MVHVNKEIESGLLLTLSKLPRETGLWFEKKHDACEPRKIDRSHLNIVKNFKRERKQNTWCNSHIYTIFKTNIEKNAHLNSANTCDTLEMIIVLKNTVVNKVFYQMREISFELSVNMKTLALKSHLQNLNCCRLLHVYIFLPSDGSFQCFALKIFLVVTGFEPSTFELRAIHSNH